MFKLNIFPTPNIIEPYFTIDIDFTLLDGDDKTITIKILEYEYDNYKDDVMGLLVYMYICYYSNDNTDGNNHDYSHVKGRCFYDENIEDIDQCKCGHYDKNNNEHPRPKFLYKHPLSPMRYTEDNTYYRFDYIKINYTDERSAIHDVNIEFSQDMKDKIIDGIISSHTIEYGKLKRKFKFNSNDDDIFIKINNIVSNENIHNFQLNLEDERNRLIQKATNYVIRKHELYF